MINKMNYDPVLNQFVVYAPQNNKKRYGGNGDGGYVLVDDYQYDFYIGCGVGWDISFDVNFLHKHSNINGLIFDGTIPYFPRLPSNLKFISKNISPINANKTTNLEEEIKPFSNVFLKMDIEANEWNWINSFQQFHKIKQFVVEVHGLFDHHVLTKVLGEPKDWSEHGGGYVYEDILTALEKINKTHYLVHFHANSAAPYTVVNEILVPTVAELTYIRKSDCGINGFNTEVLPINGLDFINYVNQNELVLSTYPFCFRKEV